MGPLAERIGDVVSFHYINHVNMHIMHQMYSGVDRCVLNETDVPRVELPAPIGLEFVCLEGRVVFRNITI
jgi:hypothetical protein